mgnify:CR=1 FL=1
MLSFKIAVKDKLSAALPSSLPVYPGKNTPLSQNSSFNLSIHLELRFPNEAPRLGAVSVLIPAWLPGSAETQVYEAIKPPVAVVSSFPSIFNS